MAVKSSSVPHEQSDGVNIPADAAHPLASVRHCSWLVTDWKYHRIKLKPCTCTFRWIIFQNVSEFGLCTYVQERVRQGKGVGAEGGTPPPLRPQPLLCLKWYCTVHCEHFENKVRELSPQYFRPTYFLTWPPVWLFLVDLAIMLPWLMIWSPWAGIVTPACWVTYQVIGITLVFPLV